MRLARAHWPPLLLLAGIAAGGWLDHVSAAFRFWFNWPLGWIWGNLYAAGIGAFIAWLVMHYGKERVGRRVGVWLHRHNPVTEAQEATHVIVADIYRAVNGGTEHPLAPGGRP